MSQTHVETGAFERKFCSGGEGLALKEGQVVEGYASVFGQVDRGGDIVERGAYATSLAALKSDGRSVKMLWQHDPAQPIGVWEEVREDGRGLFVKGRILDGVDKGREAAELVAAGAIDGLSIGYRTIRSRKDDNGRRILTDLELWEVSLVTFPMLSDARVGAKGDESDRHLLRDLATAFADARHMLARN
jgi:HK97 family phage prohead protease